MIIARLGQTPDEPVGWAAFTGTSLDEAGAADDAAAFLALLRRRGGDARIAAVLPGEQAAMRAFPSPPRNAAKFTSAARLLLEDELAQAVDDCHVATHRTDATARVYAVDIGVMRGWVDLFAEIGFSLGVLTVDFECLGGGRERPVLFLESDRVVASFGDRAFAAEKRVALAVIEDLIGQAPDIGVSVYGGPPDGPAQSADRYERLGAANDETLLRLAARAVADGDAVNLLQGAFRPRRRRIIELSRWRRPAIAAGLFALMLLALAVADGWRAKRIASRYAGEAQRLHNEYFPGAADADPRSHARSVLARGGGASFLALSDILGRALAGNDAVVIDRIRFDETQSQLVFSIRSSSDAAIETFRQSLAALGVATAETGGYRRAGAFWVGEMTARL